MLGIVEGDEKNNSVARQDVSQRLGVASAHGGRQRNQRGAVIDGRDVAEHLGPQIEKVAAIKAEWSRRRDFKAAFGRSRGRLSAFRKEFANSDVRKFDANDAMALRRQPDHVAALARHRHENSAFTRQIEQWPKLFQLLVNMRLMKCDVAVLPTLLPEGFVHECLCSQLR